MAELIKKFKIGTQEGIIDYEAGVGGNKPDLSQYYLKTEVDAKLAALTPKKAVFTFSETLTNATIFDYYQDATHFAEGTDYIDKDGVPLEYVYARNGDFGFPCIDGTGQVNFKPKFADGKTILVANVTGTYKNFKTPYLTCIDNLYRFTKVTSDLAVSLSAVADESEMPAYNITYKLEVPEGYDKSKVSAIAYRTDECVAANYKPINLVFDDTNQVVDYSYSKESGLRDKSNNKDAQVHLVVSATDIPAGYQLAVNGISFDSKVNHYKATKLSSDLEITIKIAQLATYNVEYQNTDYSFSDKAEEKPTTVKETEMLEFKYYYNADKSAVATDVSKTAARSRIDSITYFGKSLTLTDANVKKALSAADQDKKVTIQISNVKKPEDATAENIIVKLK